MKSAYELFLGKYGSLTEIQEEAFRAISKGSDNCLIIAPTGSGKTEAAIIPVLHDIQKHAGAGIRAVYVTPLRALNRDLIKRLEWICNETGIRVGVRHGDTGRKERKEQMENPPELLITTPETLNTLLLSEKFRKSFSGLRFVIVDEVHELYPNKRGAQLSIVLERLRRVAGNFRRIGISATVGDANTASRFLFGTDEYKVVKSRKNKDFETSISMPDRPLHKNQELEETFGLDGPAVARLEAMAEMIRGSAACIIFTNTRQVAEALGSRLMYMDKQRSFGGISVHHSSLDRDERIRVENNFKEGKIRAIIATSSLELGIDVGRVDLVIQYGSPRQTSRFMQRVGRSGHGEGRISVGKIIVSDEMEALESAAIVRDAVAGKLEPEGVETGALDVAINQICAMTMERRNISADDAYSILSSAEPYRKLHREMFDKLVALGSDLRMINERDGNITLGSRSMAYFFKNISVIPDTQRFIVREAVSNRTISSLDERFVYNYLDEGSSFITKGIPWRVVNVEEGVVYVEQSGEIGAAIPDWEGEDIPVSERIASEVFSSIGGEWKAGGYFDEGLSARISDFSARQKEHFSISEDSLMVEELDDYVIVYTGIGKHANELIALLMKAVLVQSYKNIEVRASAYAIVMWFGGAMKRPDMKKVFDGLQTVSGNATEIVSQSDVFRYKFVQVSKLFGVVDKKAALTKAAATRLITFYKKTPVFDETIRDLYKNNLDKDLAMALLKRIWTGEMKIHSIRSSGSPLSGVILGAVYRKAELLQPGIASDAELNALEEKLDGNDISVLCTFCGFVGHETLKVHKDQHYLCHSCKSPMLCIYEDEFDAAIKKKLDGKRLLGKDAKDYDEAIREAGLISAHGNRAVIALSTYGIGSVTASRILRYSRKDVKHFLADVIQAQKTFIRTKKFWG